MIGRIGAAIRRVGPGVLAGAADNDPTTVATLAVVGATTGYRLAWLFVLLIPMLSTILTLSGAVGAVCREGLQSVIVEQFGRAIALLPLVCLLVVNLITIAADLEGGSAALGLLFHVDWHWGVIPVAGVTLAMLVFGSYHGVARVMKIVLLVFLGYVITTFLAHPHWSEVMQNTVVPHLPSGKDEISGALALLGTTLTGYAYVWESIEEAEESRTGKQKARVGWVEIDATLGVVMAMAICWFILVGTGATLGAHHIQVQTAQDAAQALVPLAGPAAGALFAIGLLASAFIALPVVAATSAYLLADQFGWRTGISEQPRRARRFYAVIGGTIALAVVISLLGISPIQLLFVASIAGGLGTPISLTFLLLVAQRRRIMQDTPGGNGFVVGGWITAAVVGVAGVIYLVQQLSGG